MTTNNMPTNSNMEELPEKDLIAGHQARLKEIKEAKITYLNDGINPCPTNTATYNVSISI